MSIASRAKLTVMISTIGRSPAIAAPTPMPTIVFSEIGVSRTRFSPNSSSSPSVTLKAPWKTPTSSPMTKTDSSRRISSAIASRSASRIRSVAISRPSSGVASGRARSPLGLCASAARPPVPA